MKKDDIIIRKGGNCIWSDCYNCEYRKKDEWSGTHNRFEWDKILKECGQKTYKILIEERINKIKDII